LLRLDPLAAMARVLSVAALLSVPALAADPWAPVKKILQAYPLADVAFSAGDASGRKFTHEKGETAMSTPLMMASSSKFPAALAIIGAVSSGHLSLETRPHEVFKWWTKDPVDPRSRVTLRHLLSFTSGFYSPDAGGSVPCLSSFGTSNYTAEACAKEVYEQAPFEFEPGSTWCYNSFHLQVAGAMAARAAGVSVQQLLKKNLIERLNLTNTQWLGGENPQLAGTMQTTGDDYDKILRAYLAYDIVPKKLADEMERDYIDGPVKVANSSATLTKLLGHYSMCNYFECIPPKLGDFTAACKKENIHVDAGLFGYYPLVDRSRGTYMQVVLMKMVHGQADFFLPTMASMVLRRLVKGLADRAILGEAGASDSAGVTAQGLWEAFGEVLDRAGMAGRFRGPADLWATLSELGGAAPSLLVV